MRWLRDWFRTDPRRCLLVLLFMSALLLFSLLAMFATRAYAGELPVTWVAPTKNCDGTPLTNLAGYKLRWGQTIETIADPAATSRTITALAPGNWWVSIAAYNAAGEESQFVSASKVVTAAEFRTISADVFTIVKRTDRLVLLKVGTAPIGTQCIADQTVNGHYAVPRSAVTWSGLVRPDIVVAQCG